MAEYTEDEVTPESPEAVEDAEKETRQGLYKEWRNWVECAKKLRKDWEEEWKVQRLEKFFLGKQDNLSGEPIFNHFASTLKAAQPELFYTNPTFMVRPTPGSDVSIDRKAAVAEGVLAAIARHEDNLEEASELATMQAHFRVGVLKVCYDPKLEPNPQAGQPIYHTRLDGSPITNTAEGERLPITDPQTGQEVTEPDEVVSDEVYRFEWVDAKNMLLPDEGPDMKRWTKIGEEIVVPLRDAKEDTRFPADLRKRLRANESKDPTKAASDEGAENKYTAGDMIRYFECYDIRKKRWCVWADGQEFNDFLIEDVFPAGIDNHPYSILRFTPIIGPEPSPWPLPETYAWADPQTEYNTRRQQITEGCKRSARKIFFSEGTFGDEEEALKALQSSKDMEAVKINDPTKPPVTVPDPGQTPDIFTDVSMLQADWRIITGQTGARMGDPNSDTATEAAFAERASNARTADKRKIINRWLRQAGSKMFQLVQATMTLGVWVKIKGLSDAEVQQYAQVVYGMPPEMMAVMPGIKELLMARLGQEKPVEATRELITFEASVEVVPGSIRLRTLDLERKDLMEFLKLIGQFPQILMSRELLKLCASTFEFLNDRVIDELSMLAGKMMAVSAQTAGRSGDNAQGGGPGPGAEGNLQTAMAGAMQGSA